MLNPTMSTLTANSVSRAPPRIISTTTGRPRASPASQSAAAIATFTAGPAIATTISCWGLSGMRWRRATPPMGSKTMSRVTIP